MERRSHAAHAAHLISCQSVAESASRKDASLDEGQ